MNPTTLSATAIKTFEQCEAMYHAQYVLKVREASGAAAELGTSVHEVCEYGVAEWLPAHDWKTEGFEAVLLERFAGHAARYGLDATMVKDGRKMIKEWVARWIENPPHQVLSTELKETFTIRNSDKTKSIEVTYIWDRGDLHENGDVEVVDLKTWRAHLDAETIRNLIQARIYALSAAIKYKKEKPAAIWVTLDQMRVGPVSVKFTREDNAATWAYLRDVFDRILASDGTREQVGDGCIYCVRKADCGSLDRAIQAGNIQKLRNDPMLAATRLAELKAGRKAAEATIGELEEFMGELLEQHNVPELAFENGVVVKMSARKTRKPHMERITRVLPPEVLAKYGKVGLAELDEILAGDEIDDAMKREIKSYITTSVSGKPVANFPKV